MNLSSVPTVFAADTLLNVPTAPGRAGTQAWTRDGRRFRLVKNSVAGGISYGRLLQGPGPNAGHTGLVPTADVPIGARTVRVTAGGGGTNVPANTYAGGLLYVTVGVLSGQTYAIKSHDQIVAAQPFSVTLEADDLIISVITASTDRVSLIANPYQEAVISAGTAAAAGAIGVTTSSGINAGNWGYVQVEGLAVCLADAAIAVGQAVSPSITTVGLVAINSGTLPIIGSAVTAATGAGSVLVVSLALP
jgi:hypothetical protein